ncbi:hypothetical protein MMC17_008462 [Xylographa soralifera]|nr:hypothetical protein [Xylographa soralifera]
MHDDHITTYRYLEHNEKITPLEASQSPNSLLMRIRSPLLSQLSRMSSSTPKERHILTPTDSTDASFRAQQYQKGTLSRSQLLPTAFAQFAAWFAAAQVAHVHQPETVCLSTAALPSGAVSSRFVYLKELDTKGFVIYSNWATSRKASDVRTNPVASLAFWWQEVERQVRVEGAVERLSREESQAYYDLRARGSKVGAWASEQSSVLRKEDGEREVLERRVREVEGRFEGTEDGEIPVPEFWGGIRVVPTVVEFWQGRESRLHDRFRYTRVGQGTEEGEWKIERLSP